MSRVIRDQIIAGSGPDSSGDGIPRDIIEHLFNQFSERGAINGAGHDLSATPATRGSNFKLVPLPNGELAITADIEVLDEAAFAKFGKSAGFSISYLNDGIQRGDNPELSILINPAQFNFKESANSILESTGNTDFVVVERIEKSADLLTAIIIFVSNAAPKVLEGFLTASGESLFNTLKLLLRKDAPEGPKAFQIHHDISINGRPAKLILNVDSAMEAVNISTINFTAAEQYINTAANTNHFQRIIGHVNAGGTIEIEKAIRHDNITVKFDVNIPPRQVNSGSKHI